MDAFKRVMDSASKVQMDYICLQYFWIFALFKMDGMAGSGHC